MPSQSSHHMGFCSISLLILLISSIIFLLWFSLEVIGVLKLLGHLLQAFSPQTRDDQAIEQSLWQIPWQMNYFCASYVLSNFKFDIAFSYCWKRYTHMKKLMSLFQNVCTHRTNHCEESKYANGTDFSNNSICLFDARKKKYFEKSFTLESQW